MPGVDQLGPQEWTSGGPGCRSVEALGVDYLPWVWTIWEGVDRRGTAQTV